MHKFNNNQDAFGNMAQGAIAGAALGSIIQRIAIPIIMGVLTISFWIVYMTIKGLFRLVFR